MGWATRALRMRRGCSIVLDQPLPQWSCTCHVHVIIFLQRLAMDAPKLNFETHSLTSRAFERFEKQLQDFGDCSSDSAPETDNKNPSQGANGTFTDLYQKFLTINWRNIFTLFVIVVNTILVNGSISLIATFFPTKVKHSTA